MNEESGLLVDGTRYSPDAIRLLVRRAVRLETALHAVLRHLYSHSEAGWVEAADALEAHDPALAKEFKCA